jgi:RNA polymerase sigma factor (sigma-70 family)
VTEISFLSRTLRSSVNHTVEPSDHALVARLRRADAEGFAIVYERYRARIYSFLARLCRDRAEAEDLLQETWLRLARHATRLEPDVDLAAWLFAVARNCYRSHRRWALVDLDRRRKMNLWPWRGPNDPSPFDLASAGETERRIEAAIGQLAPRYREVFLLVVVEGFEPAQAGPVLGLSTEAVRQRLSRARKMIADTLGADVPVALSAAGGAR